jgi:hypothetical protein
MQRLFYLAPNACSLNRIKCPTWLVFYNTSTLLAPGAPTGTRCVFMPCSCKIEENDLSLVLVCQQADEVFRDVRFLPTPISFFLAKEMIHCTQTDESPT